MINALERDTDIKPGDTIVEFSSGNTAIGLAAIAAKRGYKMLAYMVQATEERRKLLEAYGAVVRDMTQDEGIVEVMSALPENGNSAQALVDLFQKRSKEEESIISLLFKHRMKQTVISSTTLRDRKYLRMLKAFRVLFYIM